MSAILEEDGDTTKVVFPPQPPVVDVPEDEPDVVPVAAPEDIVVPIEDTVDPSQGHPMGPFQGQPDNFYAGSKPNVVYVLCENFNLERLNTFYVLIKDHAAVMVRNQSNATLEHLRDHLLQQYPDASLVTPTFSSNNVQKSLGK